MQGAHSLAAIYNTHSEAEAAVKQLEESGFETRLLSIVGRDYHTEEQVVGYYNAGEGMKYWGKQGEFWGGVFGRLSGWAFFWVPGIGPLLVTGALAGWVVEGLDNGAAARSLSVLGAGLYGLGIPKDTILRYETAIKAGKYLLLIHGTGEQIEQAKAIVKASHPSEVGHHRGDSRGEGVPAG